MLLSIVVPTYNVESYIGNCLKSVLDQDIPKNEYEIIVVNDGSTDHSGAIATEYANQHPIIRIYNQENQGLSAARNTGIALSKGKYIYFLDSDDYVARNTLNYILGLLEKFQLDVLGIQVQELKTLDSYDSLNINTIKDEKIVVTDGISFIAHHNYLNNAWWYFINRDFLLESKLVFPVGRFVEDANFTAKLIVKSKKISMSSLDFYRYYLRPNSIMRKKNIPHIRKLIADYGKNVYEFHDQINDLKNREHSKIEPCLERLKARQQSFVFFLLIKCVKLNIPKEELSNILQEFKAIGVYPMGKFIGRDFNRPKYKILLPLLNNEKSLSAVMKLYSFIE